jgi:RNA polymerase sigma factor (sigma-70 family)
MAEYLLQEVDCSEAAEGIRHWASSWPAVDQHKAGSISDQYAPAIQQALNSYKRARDTLVNHNLRLVFSVAGKLQSPHVSFMDRVQNGVFGLIRAAEKFESSKGFRFSTYAFSWINQAIQRGLQDQRGIVRYPSDVSESISKMYRERSEFLHKYGREPGELELASLLNTKPESLFQLRQVTDIAVSFDSPLGDASNGTTLEDKLSGETFASPSALVEQESLNKSLRRCLKVLSEQEQIVVDMRWGLGESRPLSRKELSAHLSISQERIRQIEEKALEKLRHDHNMIAEYRIQRSMD